MIPPGTKKKPAAPAAPIPVPAPEATDGGYRLPRPQPGADGEVAEPFDPRRILGLLIAYWWIILLFVLAGSGAGAAYCVLATPRFRSYCFYEIYSETILDIGRASAGELQTRNIRRQMMILESEILGGRVKNKLTPEWDSRISDMEALTRVRGAKGRPGSVMQITVDSIDEDYGLEYLRELIATYAEMRKVEEMTANERALRSLRLEKMRLGNELDDARQRLLEFKARHQLLMAGIQADYDRQYLDNVLQRVNALRMERAMIGMQLRALEGANAPTAQDVLALTMEAHAGTPGLGGTGAAPLMIAGGLPGATASGQQPGPAMLPQALGVAQTGNWEKYEGELARLQALYSDNLENYKPAHPAMLALEQQIDSVKRSIEFESEIAKRRLQARFDALKIQEDALDNLTKGWQRSESDLGVTEQAEFEDMESEVEQLKNLVKTVGERIIDVSAQSAESLITRLVAEPKSQGQVWPMTLGIVGGSVGGGLTLGVMFALMLF